MTEKIQNTKSQVYQAFLDLEKAFDRIPRKEIEQSLRNRGINNKLRKAIMSIYSNTRNYIRTDNLESKEFSVNEGLRQGGVLSPTLFNVVMDDVIKDTRNETSKLHVGYRNLEAVWLTECAFADDVVLFAKNEEGLAKNLAVWNEKLSARNLKINEKKTKVMVSGKTQRATNLRINEKPVEQVSTFKYLGVHLEEEGTQEAELNTRIQNASKLYHSIKNSFLGKREVSVKAKISIYNSVFVPTLIFGCESWVLTGGMKSRIQSMEMKFLRKIMGVTRKDKIRNEVIREQLHVQPVLERIEESQLRWFGHLCRMNSDRPVRKVWEAKGQGKRLRGRPMKTWDENINGLLTNRHITRKKAKEMAQDRVKWRKFIYGAPAPGVN